MHSEQPCIPVLTDNDRLLSIDGAHVWHPYSAIGANLPVYPVVSAEGVRLRLADGRELIDGMSSWWCAIHGYNHPEMNRALENQLESMAHVMFGGLTHAPAIELAETLVAITPEPLQSVFFCDSGSVAVEVAMKMAMQYWHARGHARQAALSDRPRRLPRRHLRRDVGVRPGHRHAFAVFRYTDAAIFCVMCRDPASARTAPRRTWRRWRSSYNFTATILPR